MSLTITKSHTGVLLQDFGRYGHAPYGITVGGPADAYAFSWANYLLNNSTNNSVIEVTLGQASFTVNHDTWFAIAGGNLGVTLDHTPIENWSSFQAHKGQIIRFKRPINGLRAYLAVKGGFQVTPIMGSVATVSRDQLGGSQQNGQSLRVNDILSYKKHTHCMSRQFTSFRFIPDYNQDLYLRVIEGYQCSIFDPQTLKDFYSTNYQVGKDSNRMGYRLKGKALNNCRLNTLSEGLALGSIQLTPQGLPIVMLADHQTIGGYPKVGCVSQVDLPRLAQAKPGQSIHFQPGNLNELQQAWCRWAQFFGY
ncbi:biotin-dependent carboxyltransferase family protein [Vibrio sp. FNV 38]|nr:biotin-dependent carboxyltransferase family protein [Vibrio sp. FNV 38]